MWWSTTCSLPTRVPLQFHFLPSWWHREYGISHGERLFLDVEHRARTAREMQRLVSERFSDIGLGDPDPPLVYIAGDLANATMPAAFGCEVVFSDDRYPANLPLSQEQPPPLGLAADLSNTYPFREMIRQTEYVSAKHDVELPLGWNTMGVQNIAVQTVGAGFFAEYYARPEFARRLLDDARELMTASLDLFATRSSKPEVFWNQNCTVPLCGPRIYERQLLEQEKTLYVTSARLGIGYGIHHCGCFDEYASLYRQIEDVAMIQIGSDSDIRLALDTFPEAQVSYIVSHAHIREGPASAIQELMHSLLDAAGPDEGRLSLCVPDLEYGTPDEHVRAVVHALLPR